MFITWIRIHVFSVWIQLIRIRIKIKWILSAVTNNTELIFDRAHLCEVFLTQFIAYFSTVFGRLLSYKLILSSHLPNRISKYILPSIF